MSETQEGKVTRYALVQVSRTTQLQYDTDGGFTLEVGDDETVEITHLSTSDFERVERALERPSIEDIIARSLAWPAPARPAPVRPSLFFSTPAPESPATPEPVPEPESAPSPEETDPDIADAASTAEPSLAVEETESAAEAGEPEEEPRRAPVSSSHVQSSESAAANERVRDYLREGLTMTQIAAKEGVSHAAISQRIRRHNLRDGITPQPKATPAFEEDMDLDVDEDDSDADTAESEPEEDEDEDLSPESGPPEVVHAPRKPNPMMDKPVPALGAQRRIRALFAIGYDPTGLNVKLLGDHITVADVLNAQPSKKGGVPEIRQGDWLAIDELYQRHKDWVCTPKPGVLVNRDAPKPDAWVNIDDPNENH